MKPGVVRDGLEVWLIEEKIGPRNPAEAGEWRVLTGMTKAGGITEKGARLALFAYENSAHGAQMKRDGWYTELRIAKYVRA